MYIHYYICICGPTLLQGYGVDPLPAPSARPTGLPSGSRQASRAPSMQVTPHTFIMLRHHLHVLTAARAIPEDDLYASLTVCFHTQQ